MRLIGDGGHATVVRSVCEAMDAWLSDDFQFIAIGDNRARLERSLFTDITFATLIHPRASINQPVKIGSGTVIMDGVVIQPGVVIGRHAILNTGCTVDHHCVIGDYVHIAPGAHLCGNVHIGEGSLVGVGVGIAPNTVIPPWSLVKAARLDIVPLSSS